MNAHRFLAACMIALTVAHAASAQTPSYGRMPPASVTAGSNEAAEISSDPQPATTSRWISQTGCLCESDGVSPAIGSEFYLYSGVSFPFGSQYLGNVLQPGFIIGGGLRTLFFNDTMDRAWVVDANLNHINNRGDDKKRFPLKVLDFTGNTLPNGNPEIKLVQYGTPIRPGLWIRDTDRTFVSLGVGRDFWMSGTADEPGRKSRWGVDVGGRYGTLSQEYDAIKHRTDVIGGFYFGIHFDHECPTRLGILVGGLRGEYAYTWSDILQRASDIQEANLLFTLGLRY